MPDDAVKSDSALHGDLYRVIRGDTERVVGELLSVMRDRREEAIDRHLRAGASETKASIGNDITGADLDKLIEIKMSHSAGFAHALLQGAVEAFEDQKAGLQLLKKLIEVELVEMEHDASFASQATSGGSTAIN